MLGQGSGCTRKTNVPSTLWLDTERLQARLQRFTPFTPPILNRPRSNVSLRVISVSFWKSPGTCNEYDVKKKKSWFGSHRTEFTHGSTFCTMAPLCLWSYLACVVHVQVSHSLCMLRIWPQLVFSVLIYCWPLWMPLLFFFFTKTTQHVWIITNLLIRANIFRT